MEKQQEENKLITIDCSRNTIELYENDKLVKTLKEVAIGKNGLTNNKQEGDLCTPTGLYNLGFAFGTKEKDYEYPYYVLNEFDYWVDDVNSSFYNQWVELTDELKKYPFSYMHTSNKVDWKSAEHLIDYSIRYELALVIEYNTKPTEKNKGSAIFFHIKSYDTTSGCIATTKENLEYIIKWLGNSQAKILIKSER